MTLLLLTKGGQRFWARPGQSMRGQALRGVWPLLVLGAKGNEPPPSIHEAPGRRDFSLQDAQLPVAVADSVVLLWRTKGQSGPELGGSGLGRFGHKHDFTLCPRNGKGLLCRGAGVAVFG